MSAKFFALLTVIGANKLAKATALGTTLKITKMAVGDGGGTLPMPSAEQTKLVNEKRRAGINTLFIDSKNANQIVAEQVIPENEGGYWIREIGLFDDEGSLIAVGNCPETYKPQLQEGSGRTQTIRIILIVSHAESVELKVDPSVVLATREFVDNAIETASKSILDTVKKEYATKEDVKKKFDSSNVVHEKGASREKVISQKGVTELFQPKGSYPTNTELSAELNKKIDKSNISQQLANDVNKVPSLDLVTKELGKKQASGNYADKSTTAIQLFFAGVRAPYVDAIQGDLYVGLRAFNEVPSLYISNKGVGYNIYIPLSDGTLALESYGYSKNESNSLLDKKIDKSKLSQAIGVSPEHVMSQKACVDSFAQTKNFEATSYGECRVWSGDKKVYLFTNNNQNSGLYSVEKEGYIWGFNANGDMLGGRVPVNCGGTGARDVATAQSNLQVYSKTYINTELNKKFDKSKISQGKGVSTEHVMSQKACVDAFQGKGNYADKSSVSQQSFAGAISTPSSIIATSEVGTIALDTTKTKPLMLYRELLGRWCSIEFQVKDGMVALTSDIENSELVSHPIPWSLPTAPAGYLICQGQTFNKATYPKLATAYPSGKLPDMRGNVIRGLDAGRGVDVGRTILSEQMGNSLLSSNIFGGLGAEGDKNWRRVIDYIGISGTDNDGGYGVYQQKEGVNGQETRMRNIAFLYIVRAA